MIMVGYTFMIDILFFAILFLSAIFTFYSIIKYLFWLDNQRVAAKLLCESDLCTQMVLFHPTTKTFTVLLIPTSDTNKLSQADLMQASYKAHLKFKEFVSFYYFDDPKWYQHLTISTVVSAKWESR